MRTTLRKPWTSITFWLILVQLFTAGVAFIINLLSSASLTPADRGYLALFLQLGYLSSILAVSGVDRPYVAQASTSRFSTALAQLHRLVTPGMTLIASLLLVSGIVVMFSNIKLGLCILIGASFVFTNVYLRIIRSAAISSKSWRGYSYTAVCSQLLLLVTAGLFAIYTVDELLLWITAYVIAGMIPTVYAAIILMRQSPTNYKETNEFSSIRKEGLRLLPATLSSQSMQRADRLLLPFLASPAALGIYVVAATAVAVSIWPVQQWSDSQLKRWSSAAEQTWPRTLSKIGISAGVTLFLAGLLATVVWFAVEYLLSPAYDPAKTLLPPLIAAYVLYAVTRVLQSMMIAGGISSRVTYAEIVGMAGSVLACFLLIPGMGAVGAAYSVLIGNTASTTLCAIFWGRFLATKSN